MLERRGLFPRASIFDVRHVAERGGACGGGGKKKKNSLWRSDILTSVPSKGRMATFATLNSIQAQSLLSERGHSSRGRNKVCLKVFFTASPPSIATCISKRGNTSNPVSD